MIEESELGAKSKPENRFYKDLRYSRMILGVVEIVSFANVNFSVNHSILTVI